MPKMHFSGKKCSLTIFYCDNNCIFNCIGNVLIQKINPISTNINDKKGNAIVSGSIKSVVYGFSKKLSKGFWGLRISSLSIR